MRALLQSLRAFALSNMARMFVTLEVSRLSGWLNEVAPVNMLSMLVTRKVLKLSGWSNEVA